MNCKKLKMTSVSGLDYPEYNDISIEHPPICPKCEKPMKLDKENSGEYNSAWLCCDVGLFIG
jgi:hypothetical protein